MTQRPLPTPDALDGTGAVDAPVSSRRGVVLFVVAAARPALLR